MVPRTVRRRTDRPRIFGHREDRAFAELARRLPSDAFALMLPYLSLRTTGYRSEFHENTLERMHSRGYLFAAEVVPHRVLDREYFLWKAAVLPIEPDWAKLYAKTILAMAPDSLHIDREGAYAITHTLFYLSDWGRKPPPFSDAESDRVAQIVDSLIVHYWRLSHWDILGELLLNRVSLRASASHIVAAASVAFFNAWRSDGCIPAEGVEIPGLKESPPAEHRAIIFRACYHTTLVGVLYCLSVIESRSCNS